MQALDLIELKIKVATLKAKKLTLLNDQAKLPTTVRDLEDIFDDFKNGTSKIYLGINFHQNEDLYSDMMNSWDEFKKVLDILIDEYPNKRIEL
jgi:hypothetical protein